MKKIPLTQGLYALVSNKDYEYLSKYKWCAATMGKRYTYAKNGKLGFMHNVIMGKKFIDHIDGDGLDNRRSNLRKSNYQLNAANNNKQRRKTTSKYKGVCKHNKRWLSHIMVNQKSINLGSYKTEEEAALNYNQAATKYFGKHARLNEIAL